MDYKKAFWAVALIALLLFVFSVAWNSCQKENEPDIIVHEKIDTIYVRNTDTLVINKIYKEPSKIDTFFVFNELHDTLFVSGIALDTVNIDSLVLELVSNYPVVIDSIFIEKTITKDERFSVYLGADAGISVYGKPDIGARLGVGIGRHSVEAGYDFIGKRIVIGYRYKIFRKTK